MMKKLITTLVLLLIVSYVSFGEIRVPYAHIWPETDEISRNPVFVISEYTYSGTLVKNLNIKHNIYLKSNQKRVDLKVVKLIINERLKQAIVKPNELLERGESYELVIENAEYYTLSHNNWKVNRLVDKVKPVWSQQPFYLGNNFTCEDLSFSQPVFSTCIKDQSKVFLLTRLKNKDDGSTIQYIKPAGYWLFHLNPHEDAVYPPPPPGCAVRFAEENLEASFLIMDASGNFSESWTPPMLSHNFFPPSKEQKHVKKQCQCPEIKHETETGELVLLCVSSLMLVGLAAFLNIPQFSLLRKRK